MAPPRHWGAAATAASPPRSSSVIASLAPLALLLLIAAAAAAHGASVALGAAAITVDTSVVLLFMSDIDGGEGSQCAQMARRAMETNGSTVNFVVTGYYRTDGNNRMTDLGYREAERDRELRQYTYDTAYRLSSGLTACMQLVVSRGFGLAVHLHLDDGDETGTWRNALDFDPYTKFGALSYWDALVKPAAAAVKDANFRGAPVLFAMQAEMGATLFYSARSYRSMIKQIKGVVSEGGTPPSSVRVGVNLNWEKICGCPGNAMASTTYYSDVQARWREVTDSVSLADVRALFRAVDWIGVSAYAGLPDSPGPADLEESLRRVDRELRLFGLDLRSLNKDLVYSEYGVGGGETADYKTPARDWPHAAAAPYWGVDGRYDPRSDPWARGGNRAALRRFYNTTLQFAAAGGGPNYKVRAIFLWSIISFDVTGVHYLSYARGGTAGGAANSRAGGAPGGAAGGSYRDPVITAAIRQYNSAVKRLRAAGAAPAAPTAPGSPAPNATLPRNSTSTNAGVALVPAFRAAGMPGLAATAAADAAAAVSPL